jgi:HD-like signal output (HDOD) protein
MRHILFVDDEPHILDGLQRMLRPYRQVWAMSFALGGEAALAHLATTPVDVVVTDMRMPGIDGPTLLSHVQERFPQIVRIVLSGQTDLATMIRTTPVAHQFLAKPCDGPTLITVIERVCQLEDLLQDAALRQVVGRMDKLPPAPRLYTALTRALEDPGTSLSEIARIVEQDVAMAAKCLQLVNSAFFGPSRRVTSIQHATSYLGINMLRSLVLSSEVFGAAETMPRSVGSRREQALEHEGLLVANLARALVGDRSRVDEAFMAGILHDIGTLVLATSLPDVVENVIAHATKEGLPMYEVEREWFGVSHAEIGAYLLGMWGLPYSIVEAVAYHHAPQYPNGGTGHPGLDVRGAVCVANLLAEEQAAAVGRLPRTRLDLPRLEAFGSPEEVDGWRHCAAEILGRAEVEHDHS